MIRFRTAVVLLACIVATALGAYGLYWYDRSGRPYGELEHLVLSFPNPEGWKVAGAKRAGEVCRLRPSCGAPEVFRAMEPPNPIFCADVRRLVRRWRNIVHLTDVSYDEYCSAVGNIQSKRFSIVTFGLNSSNEFPSPKNSYEISRLVVSVSSIQ